MLVLNEETWWIHHSLMVLFKHFMIMIFFIQWLNLFLFDKTDCDKLLNCWFFGINYDEN
jgi:hypothetical protein